MLPRFHPRRFFLYVICCGCLFIGLVNLRNNWQWPLMRDDVLASTAPPDKPPPLPFQQPEIVPSEDGHLSETAELPWFMSEGSVYPTPALLSPAGKRIAKLFPDEEPNSDRITNQLMYIPPDYNENSKMKKILLYNGLGAWNPVKKGQKVFLDSKCPIDRCVLTGDREEANDADAILYKDHFIYPPEPRPKNQIWILYYLECPYHTQNVKYADVFNWTATYRRDSDIVAPYERWTYYNDKVKQIPQERNYALNKTKKVAWFVSNCGARNGRLAYAKQLQKYIQVDIYGSCGPLKCARANADRCFELLNRDYKFYLAFENSNCKDYITEKFYVNGLGQNVLPIVMGAKPEDYERSAPYKSYIHVDEFESPEELANYLHRLDKNNELYNSYFQWKGTGEFINTYFWCRLCAMLHDPISYRSYKNINDWWRGPGVCTSSSWRKKEPMD